MSPSQGRPLYWYLVVGLLFAVPPMLAAVGIRFPSQPPDLWLSSNATLDDGTDLHPDGIESTTTVEAIADVLPCVVVLQSDQLLERESLIAVRDAVNEMREKLPDCEVAWCGDAPSRTGILRRPRSVIPADDAADRHWERVPAQLREHPLAAGHLLSVDGTTMLILLSDSRVATEDTAREILSHHVEPLGIQYWLTGEALMLRSDEKALQEWTLPVLGTSALVVIVVGLLMLRDPRRSLAVSAGPIAALGFAFGWQFFLGLPFNELAAADMPVFVLVLAFSDSLHILLAVEEEFAHVQDHRVATRLAMKRMLRPCFLTSLTTSLAFASLMLSDQPMVYGFGRNAAIAISVAFVGVVTAMPLSSSMCVRWRRPQLQSADRHRDRWIQRPILFSVRHSRPTVIFFSVVTVGCLIYSANTLYPDDRIDLRLSREEPSYQGLMQCDEKLGGLRQIKVRLEWPEEMSDEAVWEVLNDVQRQVEQSESFSAPLSILNALQLLPGDEAARKLRYARRLAKDRLAEFWNKEKRVAIVEFRVPDRGVQYIESDLDELESLLDYDESLYPGLTTKVGGLCLAQSGLIQTTIREMSWSVILAAATIFLVIWIAYGRFSFALFSVLPNTFAIAFTVAIRAWMTPSLDVASACAASICLGIAVDDTVHFLEALRHARGRFGSRIHILHAGHLVGRALVITTVTLFFGFASVYITPLPTHHFFASMVIAMLPAALVGDLVILPAMLSMFRQPAPSALKEKTKLQSISDSSQRKTAH